MKFIIKTLITAIALLISAYVIPGFVVVDFMTAVIAAFVLGIINFFIRPIMILITLPVNILTLGLFTFVINALMLWITTAFVGGFTISSPLSAIGGAIVLAIVSSVLSSLLDVDKN